MEKRRNAFISSTTPHPLGCQYNIEGAGTIVAIVTNTGPNIAAQGAVESMLLGADILFDAVDGRDESGGG